MRGEGRTELILSGSYSYWRTLFTSHCTKFIFLGNDVSALCRLLLARTQNVYLSCERPLCERAHQTGANSCVCLGPFTIRLALIVCCRDTCSPSTLKQTRTKGLNAQVSPRCTHTHKHTHYRPHQLQEFPVWGGHWEAI